MITDLSVNTPEWLVSSSSVSSSLYIMDSYLTSTSCLLLVCRSHPHNCCTAYRVVLCITETYRETHHVSDPRWVEFDFGCSTICQVLIGLMRDRQNRQSRWSRCVENPNQCQPNQGPTRDRPPSLRDKTGSHSPLAIFQLYLLNYVIIPIGNNPRGNTCMFSNSA